MSDIKFSVVIPLYNKEQSIVNTLLSVLNQSYQSFEIVIINDGSTDSSVDAVKTIKDERVRLINQKNKGVSAARNKGIQESKYEWIAFLDGDDLWEMNHLKEVIKMMNLFPYNKIYVTSFEYSDKREMYKNERKSSIFKIEDYFKEAIDEILLWTSIVVLHKECVEKVGGFNINLNRGEDLDLWARLAKNYRIIKSTKITAIYRVDAENRTNLSKKLKNTHVYYFNFEKYDNDNEFNYHQQVLFNTLFSYMKALYFLCFFKLLLHHNSMGYISFLKFACTRIKNKISMRLR